MQQEFIDINKIKPNTGQIEGLPKNPRMIRDDRYEKLIKSIQDDPEMMELRELVVYPQGKYFITIMGNQRLAAMRELNYRDAPCKILDPSTTIDKLKAYTVKDNTSFGDWDRALLSEWDKETLFEWGAEIRGFNTVRPVKEDNYVIPEKVKTKIQPQDFFEIGPHRLLCADSRDPQTYEFLMAGQKADLVVTDPPYNVNYEGSTGMKLENDDMSDNSFFHFLLGFHMAMYDHIRPGGAVYVWHADSEGLNFRAAFKDSGLELKQCIIWVKNSLVMGRQDYHWKHEPCLYGWKPGAKHYFTNERTRTTVIEDQLDIKKMKKEEMLQLLLEIYSEKTKTTVIHCDKPLKNDVHPTMKPILLLSELVQNSSERGDLVLDPFGGSGSTMVTSHQLLRRCNMIELDPKFCHVILDRMLKLDPTLDIKKNGKPYEHKPL